MYDIYHFINNSYWKILLGFKNDPASWTTAILLLFTLIFSIFVEWQGRKRVKIFFGKRKGFSGYLLLGTNKSKTRNVNIISYGFNYSDGRFVEHEYNSGQLVPEGRIELYFESVQPEKINYVFLRDSTGKIYKKYIDSEILDSYI